ncbi:hypothetical protein LCGC14_0110920 [marine sediment metagenome]
MIEVREATPDDAPRVSELLTEILVSWSSQRLRSPQHVLGNYIEHPDRIRCSIAQDETGQILGFQSLKIASDGNPYGLPTGWGIIGTYVSSDAGRKGVGKALFASSWEAAVAAGLSQIDATIGEDNDPALSYYGNLGFETYRVKPGAICKKLKLK